VVAVAALPVVIALAAATLASSGPVRAATGSTRPLIGTHPAWATAGAARGATPAAATVPARVYLAGRDPARLAAYARAVSTPGNADYHHYLTPQQQDAAFGPTGPQLAAVDSWLTGAGLTITGRTEQYVSVTGTARAVGRAFSTRLRDYTLSGHVYYAPSSNAAVPAGLSAAVLGVSGLDDAPQISYAQSAPQVSSAQGAPQVSSAQGAPRISSAQTPRSPQRARHGARVSAAPPFVGLSPCSAYWGQHAPAGLPDAYGHLAPLPVCGYTPNQLRGAYGFAATGLTGQGVTVAVVDAYGSPTIASDVNTFDKDNRFPPFAAGQFSQVVTPSAWDSEPTCGGPTGWVSEESLDVEAVHTMAPGAKVVYVGADSCQDNDLLSALDQIVNDHLATIVTGSWGRDIFDTNGNDPVATIEAYTQAFEEGAAEGIGFYFASGDCSTEDPVIVKNGLSCDANSSEAQTNFPASDPWVTAVGATTIGIGAHDNYLFETGMGDSETTLGNGTAWASPMPGTFLFGSGGGTSDYFTQPAYQQGVVPNALSHTLLTGANSTAAMREVPDVAMEGDLFVPTMVGFTQTLATGPTVFAEAGYGGTSASTPLFAGVQADAQQAAGVPIGFANPVIYQRFQQLGTSAFRVVTDHPGGQTYAVAINEGVTNGVQGGSLFTMGADWTLRATAGYNDVTGVGSPAKGYLNSFRKAAGAPGRQVRAPR
jgi:subtilase family serine protease